MDKTRHEMRLYWDAFRKLKALNNVVYSSVWNRIRQEKNGGAWCPKFPISKEAKEWLQIDFGGEIKVISLVETQGRFGNGQVRLSSTLIYEEKVLQKRNIIVEIWPMQNVKSKSPGIYSRIRSWVTPQVIYSTPNWSPTTLRIPTLIQ